MIDDWCETADHPGQSAVDGRTLPVFDNPPPGRQNCRLGTRRLLSATVQVLLESLVRRTALHAHWIQRSGHKTLSVASSDSYRNCRPPLERWALSTRTLNPTLLAERLDATP